MMRSLERIDLRGLGRQVHILSVTVSFLAWRQEQLDGPQADKQARQLVFEARGGPRCLKGSKTGHTPLTCWFACDSGRVAGSIADL